MNKASGILSAVLFVCLCGTSVGFAQACTEDLNTAQWHCVFDGCQRTVYYQTPGGEQPLWSYSCTSLDCCGELITTCHFDGPCEAGGLRDHANLRRLDDVATRHNVLIADCKGRYMLYRQFRKQRSLPDYSLSDRILR